MTPKEKAQELFDKMFVIIENKGMYDDLYRAKQCALIAVDEILLISPMMHMEKFGNLTIREYFKKVKQEIEAL